jgi:hypothetical protein
MHPPEVSFVAASDGIPDVGGSFEHSFSQEAHHHLFQEVEREVGTAQVALATRSVSDKNGLGVHTIRIVLLDGTDLSSSTLICGRIDVVFSRDGIMLRIFLVASVFPIGLGVYSWCFPLKFRGTMNSFWFMSRELARASR